MIKLPKPVQQIVNDFCGQTNNTKVKLGTILDLLYDIDSGVADTLLTCDDVNLDTWLHPAPVSTIDRRGIHHADGND